MDREAMLTAFRLQAGVCHWLESPLYGGILDAAREDLAADGPVARLLAGCDDFWDGDPIRGFVPLRLLAGVHDRVLSGAAPELARFYPTVGGTPDALAAWPVFRSEIEDQQHALRRALSRFPQTNEVRRCAGLLGGFLEIASSTGLPLRLREIGCSAGLNLQWAQFRYRLGRREWGPSDSPVEIRTAWRGAAPRLAVEPRVESRAGCDLAPPRIADAEGRRVLESFVWADQPERLDHLRAAIAVARRDPPRVDVARAGDWLAGEIGPAADGCCTVVFHSSVWTYLAPDEQRRVRGAIEARGKRATRECPLAWLRHEDSGEYGGIEIRLTSWPGGEERLLGLGHAHGRNVDWRG